MEHEMKLPEGSNLESAVNMLLTAKSRGEHAYCEFWGTTLHSDDVTMDSAYQTVFGCSKEEYDKAIAEEKENYKLEVATDRERALANIPRWIERGQALIYPEKYDQWTKRVQSSANGIFSGDDIEYALKIMTILESGVTVEEAKNIFYEYTKDFSGGSFGSVRNLVFLFSKRGPEFFEAVVSPEELPNLAQEIEEQRQENLRLAQKNESSEKHM